MRRTASEAIKEIRKEARNNGMTFKKMPNVKLNGSPLYMFVNRKTGERIIWNCLFWMAYQNCLSGMVSDNTQLENKG